MAEMSWRDAIQYVLAETDEPMHYMEIADEIVAKGLRSEVGATPANTVGAQLSQSIKNEGAGSPFVRVTRGYYQLRQRALASSAEPSQPGALEEVEAEAEEAGLVNAFGMYWSRDQVAWNAGTPRILGRQQPGSEAVEFCEQRLRQHTFDRLNGRWDRFSWFGILPVRDDGSLVEAPPERYTLKNLIATMEALLIEGLEPPQKRKRGDDFRAVEFLQAEDPEIRRARLTGLLEELKAYL